MTFPSPYSVRKASEEDLPHITNIFNNEILTNTAIFRKDPVSLQDRTDWFHSLSSKGYPILVATSPSSPSPPIAAYAAVVPFRTLPLSSGAVEISVYVHPDARGQGLGKTMVNAMEDACRHASFVSIIAAITSENSASLVLFRRLGYHQVGTFTALGRKFNRWLDCTFLEKVLIDLDLPQPQNADAHTT
ncbi:MAG: putative acetyltransferase, GNAT family [Piptocephalis tieghemiana]|nr:MAG: putative acetyltransferase, GNAT family [Piptocephalis tieghemiana]